MADYQFEHQGEAFEFRGVEGLVYAEVLSDTKDGYITGAVKPLRPVAEIGRTTENSSEAHYYDNQPMIVVTSVGSDELTITISVPDLQTHAEITGQYFDPDIGGLIEGIRTDKYFAIGYKAKDTMGKNRYIWRYKGKFSIPDETHATEDDSTDTNNIELTYIGINTTYKFKKYKKSARALVCDERYQAIDYDTFFDKVNTPDTLVGTGVSGTSAPQIFPVNTYFSGICKVSIICNTVGALIYYTTDGTTPTQTNGTQYNEPFTISASTTIKAVAIANALKDSLVTTSEFIDLQEIEEGK